jgi:hypothetical protein
MSRLPDTTGPLNAGGLAWYLGLAGKTSASVWSDLYGTYPATLGDTPQSPAGFESPTTRPGGYDSDFLMYNNAFFLTTLAADVDTIACWFNPTGGGSWGGLLSQGGDDASGWQLRQYSDVGQLGIKIGATDYQLTGFPYDGVWRHIAVVRNVVGGQTLVYLNGILQTTFPETWTTNGVLALATRATRDTGTNGGLDDVRLWGRPLSSTEIGQVYSPTPPIITPTLTTAKPRGWVPPRQASRVSRPWGR